MDIDASVLSALARFYTVWSHARGQAIQMLQAAGFVDEPASQQVCDLPIGLPGAHHA